jgi:torulene dioxygenase
VNAWEETTTSDGVVDIVCEIVEFADAQILGMLQYQYIVSTTAVESRSKRDWKPDAKLTRYKLEGVSLSNARTGTDSTSGEGKKIMSIPSGDLPRINPNYCLKPHRYVYTMLDRGKSSFMDGIGKTDTLVGTTTVWERERHTPGEPIFIARPGAVDEDDGIILTVVFDGDAATSYLLCLDARTMTEMARAVAPCPIGLGFHGLHVPAAV